MYIQPLLEGGIWDPEKSLNINVTPNTNNNHIPLSEQDAPTYISTPHSTIVESYNETDNTVEMLTPHPVQPQYNKTIKHRVKILQEHPYKWDQEMQLSYMKEAYK